MAEKRERTTEEIEAARKKRMANLMSAEELNARKTPEERRNRRDWQESHQEKRRDGAGQRRRYTRRCWIRRQDRS